MKTKNILATIAIIAFIGLTGCTQKKATYHKGDDNQAQRIAELEAKIAAQNQELNQTKAENASLRNSDTGAYNNGMVADANLLPPNAKPGECYARVLNPPVYETVNKQVLKSAASEKIEVIDATYKWSEKRVLVKEEGEVLKTMPAVYDWVVEDVMVEPEKTKIITHPATYKTTSEKVLVKPAYTTWKKGRGPIEKINDATGEIMCLVEVPAEYKTVTKRVIDREAYTERKTIPAVYKKVKKKVMVKKPQVVTEKIPAEYAMVKVKEMVNPPQERKSTIPAEYGTITERKLVKDASMEWQSILCETNTTPAIISNIQRSLKGAGYNVGSVDGVMGAQTMTALKKYQMDQGLAQGKITMETLRKLGVL